MPYSTANQSPRVVNRGEEITFEVSFHTDATKSTPLTPSDPTKFPSYTFYDSEGQIITSGVAQQFAPGYFNFKLIIPEDSTKTDERNKARIDWLLETQDNRQVDFTFELDIVDKVVQHSRTRQQNYIMLEGTSVELFRRLLSEPYKIKMILCLEDGSILKTAEWPTQGPDPLRKRKDGDTYLFYYELEDSGSAQTAGTYNVLWEITETVGHIPSHEFQILKIIPKQSLKYFPQLKMLIDKMQKRLGLRHAYEQDELYEYLEKGLEIIGSWAPYITTYTFYNLPNSLQHYMILAAAWWGLNAQFLLETDATFDFSGQTVTLNWDHTGNLDSAIGRMLDYMREGLPTTKTNLQRQTCSVGSVSGRLWSYRRPIHIYKANVTKGLPTYGTDFAYLVESFGF